MFERYPSKKNLDVAYQSDFEDAAWTKFSEAQLPPPRVTLEDFAKHPFVAGEITSKSDYVRHVVTWFSKALKDAGYKENEVDGLIAKSLDVIDFNRPAEAYVADINRIIQNFYKAAPVNKSSVVETQSPETAAELQVITATPTVAGVSDEISSPSITLVENSTEQSPFAKKENPVRSPEDMTPNRVEVNANTPDVHSISNVEIRSEEESRPLATELDEREAEYAEYGNPKAEIKPLEPLVLTQEQMVSEPVAVIPEMPETQANEPIVLETVETVDEVVPENAGLASAYQSKLDALNSQPFNREAYVEFAFDLHAGLRQEYDRVVTAARNNLKRFDGFYAPSTTEKQALQLLSSLQGQFAKTQKINSEIGILRARLTNDPTIEIADTEEADVKTSAQNYIAEATKLFTTIEKLDSLVEVVKTEEKPTVAEVYRAQFEKMQTEGNQVLRSLPVSHPLYERLKISIESDLADLIKNAAIENGGDTAVLQNSSNFMARRDQIKNLIAFIKDEQEYQDFFGRARSRVQKLESQFETIPASEQGAQVKTILAENIVKIKQALSGTDSQIATEGVLENLKQQKSIIEMLLRDSEESITSLPQSETVVPQELGSRVLTDAELIAFIEKTPLAQNMAEAQERYQMRQGEIEKYLAFKREQQSNERFSGPVYEKAKRLAGMLHLGKIGKAAAVLLALAGPAGLSSQKSDMSIPGNLNLPAGMLAQSNVDYAAISEYLRTAEGAMVISETPAPAVSVVAPELPKNSAPVEAVPGVILPDAVSGVEMGVTDTPPDYYSDDADEVPSDPGVVFESPTNTNVPEALRQPYKINIGDTFWDINEGETLAGKLPVLSQINPYFKQALIDRMRDRINNDPAKRAVIGGFGNNADQLRAGELMNLDKLNELGVDLAVEYGYLK